MYKIDWIREGLRGGGSKNRFLDNYQYYYSIILLTKVRSRARFSYQFCTLTFLLLRVRLRQFLGRALRLGWARGPKLIGEGVQKIVR